MKEVTFPLCQSLNKAQTCASRLYENLYTVITVEDTQIQMVFIYVLIFWKLFKITETIILPLPGISTIITQLLYWSQMWIPFHLRFLPSSTASSLPIVPDTKCFSRKGCVLFLFIFYVPSMEFSIQKELSKFDERLDS